MKKILLLLISIVINSITIAQSYNTELNALGQYVQRMYLNEHFQGARVISDVDKCYLISIVTERPSDNEYVTQRKAEVKGLRYANDFLNGSQISSNSVSYTKETSDGYSYEEIEDFIESRSLGYVQTMQILSTFSDEQGKKVFVFCKQLPMPEQPKAKKGKGRR